MRQMHSLHLMNFQRKINILFMPANNISAKELHDEINSGALEKGCMILDVRTPAEFSESHICGSKNIELSQFTGNEDFLKQHKQIFFVCKGGVRAGKACQKIPAEILPKSWILEGGIDSWISHGFDVIRPRTVKFSVMQQVQLVIGTCVALGSILTLTVSKWFAVIPLFFGCGLIFAGLTGICMLLIAISKMPWNKA